MDVLKNSWAVKEEAVTLSLTFVWFYFKSFLNCKYIDSEWTQSSCFITSITTHTHTHEKKTAKASIRFRWMERCSVSWALRSRALLIMHLILKWNERQLGLHLSPPLTHSSLLTYLIHETKLSSAKQHTFFVYLVCATDD